MNSAPLVSVLMTAYNREKYIAEAIESVLASTYTNFELIIVDDCSTDSTVDIAKSYESKDSRVKVYVNEKNLGDYPNRNKAAGYARGVYLKYLDSDDKIFDWGLSYCVDMMTKFPEAGIGFLYFQEVTKKENLSSKEVIEIHFFQNSLLNIGPSGSIYRRSAFEKAWGFNTDFGVASDMYFNIKIASLFPVVLLREVFLFYRIHEGQEINNSYDYLYNNYNYLSDALNGTFLTLGVKKTAWLHKKNKRRFTVNIITYFWSTLNLKKTRVAIKRAGFSLSDAFEGIFHFTKKPKTS